MKNIVMKLNEFKVNSIIKEGVEDNVDSFINGNMSLTDVKNKVATTPLVIAGSIGAITSKIISLTKFIETSKKNGKEDTPQVNKAKETLKDLKSKASELKKDSKEGNNEVDDKNKKPTDINKKPTIKPNRPNMIKRNKENITLNNKLQ